ncbi:tRNA glutamyl-Q(34) synthetase GluQRS [Alkalicaulis satelles]|uniref:tRNA glutamyl-Q(34) synthetase GluQRS n=1 Tax=Alkalicaulis satelles TaxID=2609175 RepID=A0A5M6ZLX3_9PROT|nr:tRNA glutamyl-Q(34) synthetase GluQRS [Alkalicaulis satelles]KAA5805330.1 tRNA glutamyl-Q(34) synthetase GluQRS [Alkalicaulis satelles]
MTRFITRFAPSPTGRLHLGHAFSALTAFEAARAAGGTCLLRIEDIDQTRCRPEYEAGIYEDLAWLGLAWPAPVRRQSDHMDEYARALARLARQGLVYRCFKTRREIAEESARAPHHPGEGADALVYTGPAEPMSEAEEAERLARGEAFAWRLSLKACREALGARYDALEFVEAGEGPDGEHGVITARPDTLGDVILARKDAGTSYHLACVHDDALQGVTHVIRGQDLFFATHLHRLLQALMDWPVPVWRHHRLLTGADGKRFAKRDRSQTLQAMRQAGAAPDDVRRRAGL